MFSGIIDALVLMRDTVRHILANKYFKIIIKSGLRFRGKTISIFLNSFYAREIFIQGEGSNNLKTARRPGVNFIKVKCQSGIYMAKIGIYNA